MSSLGEADPRINLFFRVGPMAAAQPSTWRRYAHALVVWLDFLAVFGRRWDEASAGDVEAFKDWRLTDTRNPRRVAPTSFDTDRAALATFYGWASARFGVSDPVRAVGRPRIHSPGASFVAASPIAGRDGLRPASSARRQVKWLLRPAFEQWRDIGVRGYGFDGLRCGGWRGAHEDRDVAFVDGLYGTGLRLQEWATVLDVEVPAGSSATLAAAWLAAACSKGGRHGRAYRIPRRVVAAVAAYTDRVEGSRAEVIRRAQHAGRYEQLGGVRLVKGFDVRTRMLLIEDGDGAGRMSADAIGPAERRLLFRRTTAGLEPLALWLSSNGLPKVVNSWEDTFAAANARVERRWVETGGDTAATPLFCRPHMCRHSFALKWFTILSVVWQQRLDGFTAEELKDLRDQFGDVWYQLAALLGHSNPQTTRDYYLEPFTGLQVDYVLALLDTDEQTAVDALVRAVAQDSPLVLASADRQW